MAPARPEPAFRVLEEPSAGLPAVAAVDGAARVLEDGPAWNVAVRSVAVSFPGTPAEAATHVTRTDAEHAREVLRQCGFQVEGALDVDRFAGALCAAHEYELARSTLETLPPGSLLLLDGALRGLDTATAKLVDRLEEVAGERGVYVVGVVRNSGLLRDGAPLLAHLRVAGVEAHPGEPWMTPVEGHPDSYACLLDPRAPRAYRVDAAAADALPHLLRLARDHNHLGYPYPLAVARRSVAWDLETTT